jgi:hypothetical protein
MERGGHKSEILRFAAAQNQSVIRAKEDYVKKKRR